MATSSPFQQISGSTVTAQRWPKYPPLHPATIVFGSERRNQGGSNVERQHGFLIHRLPSDLVSISDGADEEMGEWGSGGGGVGGWVAGGGWVDEEGTCKSRSRLSDWSIWCLIFENCFKINPVWKEEQPMLWIVIVVCFVFFFSCRYYYFFFYNEKIHNTNYGTSLLVYFRK